MLLRSYERLADLSTTPRLILLEFFEVVPISPAMVKRVVEIKVAYFISFWDASIISAAEYADCDVIYSEDLNSGQFYSGIKMQNPFIIEC